MGKDQNARDALDALERERLLPLDLLAAALSSEHQLLMPGFGLGQAALGALVAPSNRVGQLPDLLVGALDQLGERDLDVLGNAVQLGQPLGANLLQKRVKRL